MMDALDELKLEQELRGDAKPADNRFRTQAELNRGWTKLTKPMLGVMTALANAPDSLEAVKSLQETLPPNSSELATMSPDELLRLCRQLRAVWTALDRSA